MEIEKEKFERAIVTVDVDNRDQAVNYLWSRGYKLIKGGPQVLGPGYINSKKVVYVGERPQK